MTSPVARQLAVLLALAIAGSACGGSPPTADEPDRSRPVIVDTDLDVSDVAAIAALMHAPGIDVLAVTLTPTGTGITSCDSGMRVLGYVLEQLDVSDVPVACGREDAGPDAVPFPEEWRSAADSGWGIDMTAAASAEAEVAAADLLARVIEGSDESPVILMLGPWTNLEDLIAAEPLILGEVAGIHAMAGAIDAPGNVLTHGFDADDQLEWNVVSDPSACAAGFASEVPLSLVPLDATDDVPVGSHLVAELGADRSAPAAELVYQLFVHEPRRMSSGQQLWDELAALSLPASTLVQWQDMALAVTPEGRLHRADDGRLVRVAMQADASATEAALLTALRRGPQPSSP